MPKPNKTLNFQYILIGAGTILFLTLLLFLIKEYSIAEKSVITVSMIALAGGLVFESIRIAEKPIHVLYIFLGAFLISFFAFLPNKGEQNYHHEAHLEIWPYWFIGSFLGVSSLVYFKKAIRPMTEGITLIQSIAVIYWTATFNPDINNQSPSTFFVGIAFLLALFSIVHALTNLRLSKAACFVMSLWSSIIMLLFSYEQVNSVLFNPDSNGLAYDSDNLFMALQYFLLGVSAIYILLNAILVLGFIPHKGDYRRDVIALTQLHLERFSKEQVYRGHALACIAVTSTWYGLNYYFKMLPVGTAIWVGFVVFPLLLRVFDIRIFQKYAKVQLNP